MARVIKFTNGVINVKNYFKQVISGNISLHASATAVTLESVNRYKSLSMILMFLNLVINQRKTLG